MQSVMRLMRYEVSTRPDFEYFIPVLQLVCLLTTGTNKISLNGHFNTQHNLFIPKKIF